MNQNIDFVVLWVNGEDPEWRSEKEKYIPKDVSLTDANRVNRFRDWGLMKYWFRGVEKFAPWVHKIHFVTWGHLPDFLETRHPKLHIVRHEEFMPPDTLPCFNSSALEINIHKIKGLAERFVYFNDDMFLVGKTSSETFFLGGKPCLHYAELPFSIANVPESWNYLYLNDMGIVNAFHDKRTQIRCFRKKYHSMQFGWKDVLRSMCMEVLSPDCFSAFKNFHCPTPFLKQTFWAVTEKAKEQYEETSRHKFRDNADISQWLMLWWQLAEGDFVPRRSRSTNILCKKENRRIIRYAVRSKKYEMICLNDQTPDNEFMQMKHFVQKEMCGLFPERSAFEKRI